VKIQPSVLVHLGFGKYVRSDNVVALIPLEQERGPGRRTVVYLQGQTEPIVVSRSEDTIVRDLVQEPHEVTQSRQQQEILRDLLQNLDGVNATVRRISRDEGGLDLDRLEDRIMKVLELALCRIFLLLAKVSVMQYPRLLTEVGDIFCVSYCCSLVPITAILCR
jgi:hypothetical protein